MTPTIFGRLQTRLLIFLFVMLPIAVVFSVVLSEVRLFSATLPFMIVIWMTVFGLVLDFIYIQIQRFRWDQDWPFVFQLLVSCLEFLVVLFLGLRGQLLWVAPIDITSNLTAVLLQFGITLFFALFAVLGGIQIFSLNWRFKAGEFGRL